MSSSRDFLEFVLDQLSILPDITYRAMMGEFIIYYRGTIVGGIYDNRLLMKPTGSALKLIPNAKMEIPYPKGKPMLMITDVEDTDLLKAVFDAVYGDLVNKS